MVGVVTAFCALAPLLACAAAPPPPDRIFVSQAGSGNVAVIDGASGAVQARIDVGMLPHQMVLSPDRRTLYVALVGSQAIAEIDVASAKLRRTMLTAPVPQRRPDGSVIRAHAAQNAFAHTTCYDCHRAGGAQPKYAGDRPFGLLLSRDGTRLLVSHVTTGNLSMLELASGRIERTVHLAPAGAAAEPVALARLGDEIWVALRSPQPSMKPGVLRRLAEATLLPLRDVPTGADPASLLPLPDRARVLVTNFETDSITEHGPDGAAVRHRVSPGPLGMTALPGGLVLALDYYSNAVSFLDPATGTSETVPLQRDGVRYANPTNAALSSDGRRAFIVTSGTDGHLLQMDLASRRVVADATIDGLSFGVALVPGTIR